MDDGDVIGSMRMGIDHVGSAVGSPTRMADADSTGERFALQERLEIAELTLGPRAGNVTGGQSGDDGRVIGTIVETSEPVGQERRDGRVGDECEDGGSKPTSR